jgi:type IV pilus assembly protein PilE
MKRRQRGLTLIELMVVVAVVAILAAVAYPLYTEQTRKARRTEGRGALLELAQAQERFYTVNGRYSNDPVALGVAAAEDVTDGAYPTDTGYYSISIAGAGGGAFDGTGFELTATPAGSQAADVCTSMTIDHLGVKDGAGEKCW